MTFNDWLDAEPGRASRLARHLSLARQTVSGWRTSGVPRKYILAVHEYCGKVVSLEHFIAGPGDAAPQPVETAPVSTMKTSENFTGDAEK